MGELAPKEALVDAALDLLADDDVDFVIDLDFREDDGGGSYPTEERPEVAPRPLPLTAEEDETSTSTTTIRPSLETSTTFFPFDNNPSSPDYERYYEPKSRRGLPKDESGLEIKIQEHLANIERAARKLLLQRSDRVESEEEVDDPTKTVRRRKKRKKKAKSSLRRPAAIEDVFTTTVSTGITGAVHLD